MGNLTSAFARYPVVRETFLRHLARYGSMAAACAHVRTRRENVATFCAQHPEFQAEIEQATNEHHGAVERAIYERAVEGVDEPRFGPTGLQVGTTKKYSDQLLLAYAKRHLAEYREGDVSRVVTEGTVRHEHAVDVRRLDGNQRAALRVLLGEGEGRSLPVLGEAVSDRDEG
jgi:hypothetical protein